MARKKARNLRAGQNFRVALELLAALCNFGVQELIDDPEWKRRHLTTFPSQLRKWCESGIPDESDKIARVAGVFSLTRNDFTELTPDEFHARFRQVLPTSRFREHMRDSGETTRLASRWVERNYSLRFLKAAVDSASGGEFVSPRESSDEISAFGMMWVLYAGGAWKDPVLRNVSNEHAVRALFQALTGPEWWRVRFRSLYALQRIDRRLRDRICGEFIHLPSDVNGLIQGVVRKGTVAAYINAVATDAPPRIATRAAEVVEELQRLWEERMDRWPFPRV